MTIRADVILADPPWKFRVWDKDTGQGRSAESHYPTMDVDAICNLPIGTIVNKNAALFLWTTFPVLLDAFRVIDAWDFTYKTIAWNWIKSNRGGFGHFMGMGYYTRTNSEPCLLAIKGRMPVVARDVLSLIYSPVREHSRKPDEQYNKIERLYPDKTYVELFARRKRDGWLSWGNEIESDFVIEEPE